MTHPIPCPQCYGTGRASLISPAGTLRRGPCPRCGGRGVIEVPGDE